MIYAFLPLIFLVAPLTYGDGMSQAKRDGKPLVTFIGLAPRPVDGCVTCWTAHLWDDPTPRIVVSDPQYFLTSLPVDATTGAILEALKRRVATPRQANRLQDSPLRC